MKSGQTGGRRNNVVVDLTTHEAGGITHKDLDLAREMEDIFH